MKIVDMKLPEDGRGAKTKNKEYIDAFCNLEKDQCLVLPKTKKGRSIYSSIRKHCIKYKPFREKYRAINENEFGLWRVEK